MNRFRAITMLVSILKECFQAILWHKLLHVEKRNLCINTWLWAVSCLGFKKTDAVLKQVVLKQFFVLF